MLPSACADQAAQRTLRRPVEATTPASPSLPQDLPAFPAESAQIFATTDGEGRFVLPGLPPGDYDVTVWHERFRGEPQRVTLLASDAPTGKRLTLRVR
jgi:hypothetical protein